MKELQVNYEQLRAEKHNNTLGNTVREKITETPLSTAQGKREEWSATMFLQHSIIQHITEQLQQPNCDNIPTLRAQLQVDVSRIFWAIMNWKFQEPNDSDLAAARHMYENWMRNKPLAAAGKAVEG